MYSYSSAQGNTVSPCPCGVFHPYNNHCTYYNSYSYADNSSAVDCTLSLGTPSTRRTSAAEPHRSSSSGNRLSNFCWDFLHQTTNSKHSSTKHNSSSHRPNADVPAAAADPMLSRRCANCDTTSTPLWRNGPRGPKSLCNACGIRYKKEERRATAAASNHSNPMMESHVGNGGYNYWGPHHQGQKELRFVDDVVSGDSDSGSMQFLSWRLNLTDRPTSQLVYDFTR